MTNSKIDRLNRQLKEIKEAYDTWKESGLNPELLEIYLATKCKLPRKTIRKILLHQKEFFENLIKEETVKRLGK